MYIMAGLRITICFMLILVETLSVEFWAEFDPVVIDNFDEGKAEIENVPFSILRGVHTSGETSPTTYSVTVTATVDAKVLTISLRPEKQNVTADEQPLGIGGSGSHNKGFYSQNFLFNADAQLNAKSADGVLTGNLTATFFCTSKPEDLCGGPSSPSRLDKLLFIETRKMNISFSHDVEPAGDFYRVTVTVSKPLATVGNLTLTVRLTPDSQELHELSQNVVLGADEFRNTTVFDSVLAGEYTPSIWCAQGLCELLRHWINFLEDTKVIAHKSFDYYQKHDHNLTEENSKLRSDKELLTKDKNNLQADIDVLNIEVECLRCKLGWGTGCDGIKYLCVCSGETSLENGEISYAPPPENAEAKSIGLGTVATYTCDDGFVLVGENKRSCVDFSSGVSAEFSGIVPTCQPIVCSELPAPENGMISYGPDSEGPDYNFGTVATYNCNGNLVLAGDKERTCGIGSNGTVGQFTGSDPICKANVKCSKLKEFENGMISYGPDSDGPDYDLNTVATYTCDKGFVLDGENTRKCGPSGKFSGIKPTCKEDTSTDAPSGTEATTVATGYSRYMEVAVGGLIAVLVVSLLGYLLYHYRVQVKEWVCSNKNAISNLKRPSLTRSLRRYKGGGRYTKLPRTMQEVLHQD